MPQRWKAKCYCDLVIEQRHGVPKIDLNDDWPALTFIPIPPNCVAMITGRNGRYLRDIEADFNCLLLFVNPYVGGNKHVFDEPYEKVLAAFGTRKGRCGAKFRIMSTLAQKVEGYLGSKRSNDEDQASMDTSGERTQGDTEKADKVRKETMNLEYRVKTILDEERHHSDAEFGDDEEADNENDTWGIDEVLLRDTDYAYALGKAGATKRKLAAASGCLLEYFYDKAILIGNKTERGRGKQYLKWLLEQKSGITHVTNEEDRKDCTIVDIDSNVAGFVQGKKGVNLREIEARTRTFIFLQRYYDDSEKPRKDRERVLIFSFNRQSRSEAKELVFRKVDQKLALDERAQHGHGHRPHSRGRGGHQFREPHREESRYRRDAGDYRSSSDLYDNRQRASRSSEFYRGREREEDRYTSSSRKRRMEGTGSPRGKRRRSYSRERTYQRY